MKYYMKTAVQISTELNLSAFSFQQETGTTVTLLPIISDFG